MEAIFLQKTSYLRSNLKSTSTHYDNDSQLCISLSATMKHGSCDVQIKVSFQIVQKRKQLSMKMNYIQLTTQILEMHTIVSQLYTINLLLTFMGIAIALATVKNKKSMQLKYIIKLLLPSSTSPARYHNIMMMVNLTGLNYLSLYHSLMMNLVIVMQKMIHQNHHCQKKVQFSIFKLLY